MRASPEEQQEMADAIAAFKKALRETIAKDLRKVARWCQRTANRLDPPPLLRLLQDLGRLVPPAAPQTGDPCLNVRGPRECGQIVYATGPGWGQVSKPGGVCRLDRGHDGDHVPT